MTGPGDELEHRVRLLEDEVARMRRTLPLSSSDSAAARVLASGADRDVSEMREALRAHTAVLNALRETQLEQGRRIAGVEQRLGGVEQRLDGVEQRVGGVEQRMADGFATMKVGMERIVELLEDRP